MTGPAQSWWVLGRLAVRDPTRGWLGVSADQWTPLRRVVGSRQEALYAAEALRRSRTDVIAVEVVMDARELARGAGPGTWRPPPDILPPRRRQRLQALVCCPECGAEFGIRWPQHVVAETGDVEPAVTCVTCGWEEWVRLSRWEPR